MSDDTVTSCSFTSCAGPYTRIPFDRVDLKPTQILLDGLANQLVQANTTLSVRERPSGLGGANDFNLHIDIVDRSAPDTVWDVRAAKFIGPKKFFGRGHIYEIAVRKRDQHNDVIWEGYLFADKFKALAQRFPLDLQHLIHGDIANDWLPADRAQAERIRLCAGE